jgi:hypothetical protein
MIHSRGSPNVGGQRNRILWSSGIDCSEKIEVGPHKLELFLENPVGRMDAACAAKDVDNSNQEFRTDQFFAKA